MCGKQMWADFEQSQDYVFVFTQQTLTEIPGSTFSSVMFLPFISLFHANIKLSLHTLEKDYGCLIMLSAFCNNTSLYLCFIQHCSIYISE